MSEPTLTDEQRETLWRALRRIANEDGSASILRHDDRRHALSVVSPVVAAMLADERAAREAAEDEARRNRAALAALRLRVSDKALAECEQELAAATERAEAAEAKVRDLTAGIVALADRVRDGWFETADDLRALVDDPAAALAEVRAEAWGEGYEAGMRDGLSWPTGETSNPYRSEAEGAGR